MFAWRKCNKWCLKLSLKCEEKAEVIRALSPGPHIEVIEVHYHEAYDRIIINAWVTLTIVIKSYCLCAVGNSTKEALCIDVIVRRGHQDSTQFVLYHVFCRFICDFSVKLHYFLFKVERENSLIRSMTNPKADVSTKEGRFFPSTFLRATSLSV